MEKRILFGALLALLLQACATPRNDVPPPTAAAAPAPAPVFDVTPDPIAEQKLREVGELYERGDYPRVVSALLNTHEVWNGTIAQRMQGHKLLAFSACLSRKQPLCEQQFAAALRLNPKFELTVAERSHPQWGPAFDKAKGEVLVAVDRNSLPPAQANARRDAGSGKPGMGVSVNTDAIKAPTLDAIKSPSISVPITIGR